MTRRIEALPIEGYLRSACYRDEIRQKMSRAVRECKENVDPDSLVEIPQKDQSTGQRVGREDIERFLIGGSSQEIAGILTNGRFIPSGLCHYRMNAENSQIPHDLQYALVKRFIDIGKDDHNTRESRPNKVGIGMLVATAVAVLSGLGDTEFVVGVISSTLATFAYWRTKERKVDLNRDLAKEILGSERLSCGDAREALQEFCQLTNPSGITKEGVELSTK